MPVLGEVSKQVCVRCWEGRECAGFLPEFFSSSGNNFLPTSGGDKSLEDITGS